MQQFDLKKKIRVAYQISWNVTPMIWMWTGADLEWVGVVQ